MDGRRWELGSAQMQLSSGNVVSEALGLWIVHFWESRRESEVPCKSGELVKM